jgi:hypothetical protein
MAACVFACKCVQVVSVGTGGAGQYDAVVTSAVAAWLQ